MEKEVYMLALRNNQELIVRAAEIQAGLWANVPVGIDIRVRYKGEQNSISTWAPVVISDPYRMKDPYLVRIGTETVWVTANDTVYVSIPKPVETQE